LLARPDLSDEAIRLARMLHRLQPDDGEVDGLLALMLLTDARRPARSGPAGTIVPLDEQDRSLWQPEMIAEGVDLVSAALARSRIGPYQLQAAIAAVHDEAAPAAGTDWAQILMLYGLLEALSPSPVVTTTGRWGSPWSPALPPASPCWSRWPPTRAWPATDRRAGASAGAGRGPGGCPSRVPPRRPVHDQPPGAALPGILGRPPRGAPPDEPEPAPPDGEPA
jgi:hypothetical protein